MPEGIGAWGREILAKESPYRLIGEQLYEQYREEDFADLYAVEGKPGLSPVDLGFVTVLQFLEDLSDRQAAEALRVRLDWKYALHLPLGNAGFDFSVLSEYRDRLRSGGAASRFFDRLLGQMQALGLLKHRGRQRTDSLAILSKVRRLNRLERVVETLRLALQALQAADEGWFQRQVPGSWRERYGARCVAERLSASVRALLEAEVGSDGQWLLECLHIAGTPEVLLALPEVQLLVQVWAQQFTVVEGAVVYQQEGPYEGHTRLQSPHDPEARYSEQGAHPWVGYKLQVTESEDEQLPHLLTDIAMTSSVQTDAQALPAIQERLQQRGVPPKEQFADKAYVNGPTLAASEQQGIDLMGPIQGDTSPQARQPDGLSLEHFTLDRQACTATCPAGQVAQGHLGQEGALTFSFAKAVCLACPCRPRCCAGQGGRTLTVGPYHEWVVAARVRQKTEAFRELYRHHRGNIEGTLSALVRGHGVRVARYLGQAKEHLRALYIGAAVNIRRAARWLAGFRPQVRRKAPLLA
jgi:transposase